MRINCSSAIHLGVPVWLKNRNDSSVSERETEYGDKSYINAQHAESCYKMWEKYYSEEAEQGCVTLWHDTDEIFTLVRCSPVLASTRKFDQYYWVVDRDINNGRIGTINKAHNIWTEHMTTELKYELETDYIDDIVMSFDCEEPKVVLLNNVSM